MTKRLLRMVTCGELCAVLLLSFLLPTLCGDDKSQSRLEEAATVFSEIMASPDKGIPQDLLEKAHCIVIVPGLKKCAFIVGAKYGKGFLSCRPKTGPGWSAPGAVRVEGGSDRRIGNRRDPVGHERAGSRPAVVEQIHAGRRG